MWTKISNWFKKIAYEEYELTVWFDDSSVTDKDGNIYLDVRCTWDGRTKVRWGKVFNN